MGTRFYCHFIRKFRKCFYCISSHYNFLHVFRNKQTKPYAARIKYETSNNDKEFLYENPISSTL